MPVVIQGEDKVTYTLRAQQGGENVSRLLCLGKQQDDVHTKGRAGWREHQWGGCIRGEGKMTHILRAEEGSESVSMVPVVMREENSR